MNIALAFVESPPGLGPLVDFTLTEVDGAPGLHVLRSLEQPDIRLFVVDVPVYLPWYEPVFSREHYAAIGAEESASAEVLVVATITEGSPVVNLMAPMLVNRENGAAKQIILGDEWPLQARLNSAGAA
ncbi:MAG: Flagellar assembly factor FliW [Glaciihabitans sp.]|nr:Flagellar assembly factor FliW [Glaciihabitans sp.]